MGGSQAEIRRGAVFAASPDGKSVPRASAICGSRGPSPMRGFIPPPNCQLSRLNLRSSAHDKGTVFGASALRRVPSGACGVRRLLRQAIRSEGRRKVRRHARDTGGDRRRGEKRRRNSEAFGRGFSIGTVYLRDNIGLEILPGAKLKASADKNLYNRDDFCPQNAAIKSERASGAHLLVALEAENVSVFGGGEIDGSGLDFWMQVPENASVKFPRKFAYPRWRPGQMLFFCECRGVSVRNVRLSNAPFGPASSTGVRTFSRPDCR